MWRPAFSACLHRNLAGKAFLKSHPKWLSREKGTPDTDLYGLQTSPAWFCQLWVLPSTASSSQDLFLITPLPPLSFPKLPFLPPPMAAKFVPSSGFLSLVDTKVVLGFPQRQWSPHSWLHVKIARGAFKISMPRPLGVELLCHKVDVHLALQETARVFQSDSSISCSHQQCRRVVLHFHHIWYCQSFLIWAILVDVNGISISLWF